MNHLTMDQLQSLREPASNPGSQTPRQHLEHCPACRDELERVHQLAAQLKALPVLRPPRDRWPAVRAQVVAQRRRRRATWVGVSSLAMAASIALVMVLTDQPVRNESAEQGITTAMAQSQLLEEALDRYRPGRRVTDGRTATVVAGLEGQIAEIDRQLQAAGLLQAQTRDDAMLRLWRQRVGLMDALVNVHLTRATNAGL